MKYKPEDFKLLETLFKDIKSKRNIDFTLESIRRVIKRNFDIDMTFSIVDNKTNEFFGMCIYPDKSTIDRLIENIVTEANKIDEILDLWQKNKTWYVEIDSILLYDRNLNANPAEITAVLLHEIGHIIGSNKVPSRLYRIVRYELMKLDYNLKQLIKNPNLRSLFGLTIIEACASKNFKIIDTDSEFSADKFVITMGYRDELNNLLSKMLKSQGNRKLNRTEKDVERDIKIITTWTIDNIDELKFRKRKLENNLGALLLRNPSTYIKSIIDDIKTKIFTNEQDEYKKVVIEQYRFKEYDKILTESIKDLFGKNGKVKKITQADIDILSIEMDKIENHDDKIYVLDLIYDKMDIVNTALDLIAAGERDKVQQSKQTLLDFKNQLETLRKDVLRIQIKDKQYGLFVKYPKGYEG